MLLLLATALVFGLLPVVLWMVWESRVAPRLESRPVVVWSRLEAPTTPTFEYWHGHWVS